ncbi:hypothetical protein UlMin_027012 [Ulmus minor]
MKISLGGFFHQNCIYLLFLFFYYFKKGLSSPLSVSPFLSFLDLRLGSQNAPTFLFSTFINLSRHPFLHRHSINFGSMASLLTGATKQAADELGYFRSNGASMKDAVVDVLGVMLASFCLDPIVR